jgi:hypothetical protein
MVGNKIGTNMMGMSALGNTEDGVLINGNNNTVGATGNNGRNIISGNNVAGIEIGLGNLNLVVNCYIGTDATGNNKIPNGKYGVKLGDDNTRVASNDNTIGGVTSDLRNVISGNGTTGLTNADFGVYIAFGSMRNVIEGDYIGVGANGTTPLGNNNDGIYVEVGCDNNTIGGTVAAARNIISANGHVLADGTDIGFGVSLWSNNNLVENNFIGLDSNGNNQNGAMNNKDGWQDDNGTGNQWVNNQHQ